MGFVLHIEFSIIIIIKIFHSILINLKKKLSFSILTKPNLQFLRVRHFGQHPVELCELVLHHPHQVKVDLPLLYTGVYIVARTKIDCIESLRFCGSTERWIHVGPGIFREGEWKGVSIYIFLNCRSMLLKTGYSKSTGNKNPLPPIFETLWKFSFSLENFHLSFHFSFFHFIGCP